MVTGSMSDSIADKILRRMAAGGGNTLSAEEIAQLESESAASSRACKLLSMHHFNKADYPGAARYAAACYESEPTPENASNLLSIRLRERRFEDAYNFLQANAEKLSEIDRADRYCQIYEGLGERGKAIEWGNRSLALKDAAAPNVEVGAPIARAFDPTKPERNIISFSLFGSELRYLMGARHNAIVARYLYPGWTPRFYVDDSVPTDAVETLLREGAQIRKAPNLPSGEYGLYWRFLVEDDAEVDFYLVRDADSVMNVRERAAVEDWLASGLAFHVMRDFPTHCELVLAGMWGAQRGNLGPMGRAVLSHVRQNAGRLNDRNGDQRFLQRFVWPRIKSHALVHDAYFSFGEVVRFRKEFSLPWPMHIGQNDAVRFRRQATPEKNGEQT